MIPRVVRLTALVAALGLTVAGCTSAASNPVSPTSPGSSTSPTVTGIAPTAPTSAVASLASCDASSTRLTYHHHLVATDGAAIDVAPGEKDGKSPKTIPVITVVHAKAPGLGRGSELLGLLRRHWHLAKASIAALGRVSPDGTTPGVFTFPTSNHPKTYAVYYEVTVYTGTFTAVCGGRRARGHYVTYAHPSQGSLLCSDLPKSALGRLVGHQVCGD